MQKLIKYCPKEYNIQLDCKTIKVGSLDYYRRMDPKFSIADPNEGIETTIIGDYNSEQATPDTKKHLNLIDGEFKMHHCTYTNRFPNSLIFCLSLDPGLDYIENAKKIDITYDSWYIVTNINLFALKLANIIVEAFKVAWFDNKMLHQLDQFSISDYKQIGLAWQSQEIKYVNTKNPIIVNSKLTHGAINDKRIDRLVFSKEDKFKENKEYRILFCFQHPRYGVIPVREEPIILSINPLASELLPIS